MPDALHCKALAVTSSGTGAATGFMATSRCHDRAGNKVCSWDRVNGER